MAATMFDFPNPSGKEWAKVPQRNRRKPAQEVTVRGQEPEPIDTEPRVMIERTIRKYVKEVDAPILLRNGWRIVPSPTEGKES